jgi:hypothetical protein
VRGWGSQIFCWSSELQIVSMERNIMQIESIGSLLSCFELNESIFVEEMTADVTDLHRVGNPRINQAT